jgi:hypothetical protein
VFRTIVPRNVRLAEAPSFGKPVLQHDKDSRGALAYLALAGEMLRKEDDAAANDAEVRRRRTRSRRTADERRSTDTPLLDPRCSRSGRSALRTGTRCGRMLRVHVRAGETYSFAPDIAEAEARTRWIDLPQATFVATQDGRIVGTYFIKANQPGLGHTSATAAIRRRPGCAGPRHCRAHVRALAAVGRVPRSSGAMQFNFVVSHERRAPCAVAAPRFSRWSGGLPGAFRHPRRGFVDALVMFKTGACNVYHPPP